MSKIYVALVSLHILLTPPGRFVQASEHGATKADHAHDHAHDHSDFFVIAVESLYHDFYSWKLALYPESAVRKGFHEYDAKLPNRSVSAHESEEAECLKFKRRAESLLNSDDLPPDHVHFVRLVLREAKTCAKGMKYMGYLFAEVNFMEGVHYSLPGMFRQRDVFRTDTLDDFENLLKNLEAIPAYLDGIVEVLQEGARQKKTYARESFRGLDAIYAKMQVVEPSESDFFVPFKGDTLTSTVANNNRTAVEDIQSRAKVLIAERVLPAYAKLYDYINVYIGHHLRPAPGVWSVPNGKEFYRACLEFHTTIRGVTPEEVFRVGIEEIRRLHNETIEIASKNGMNMSFLELMNHISNHVDQSFTSEREVFDFYKSVLSDKINPKLKDFFPNEMLTPNVYNLDVRPSPPDKGGLAYYQSASPDGRRTGAFLINTRNLDAIKKHFSFSLALHEGNPGHHLQLLYNTHSGQPDFVRNVFYGMLSTVPSRTPINTAHVEGWALYAEYLGLEMGVYENDFPQLMGFYTMNLLRAARLVVDTGIHYFEWDRQRAVDFLVENTGLSMWVAEAQIDRYITWPGQATAYKMGEMRIRRARRREEDKLGDKFDLKHFHKSVLFCLGPIDGLEECVHSLRMHSEGDGAGGGSRLFPSVQNVLTPPIASSISPT